MPINSKDNKAGLRSYVRAVSDTITHIHGVWAKPMYSQGGDVMKAKAKPNIIKAKPASASDECYILGFQSKGGLTPSLVEDVAHYAEAISKDPEFDRIIYRGMATVGNTVVIYFDKTALPESTGLELIAQQYKSAGRPEFIKDIIQAARAAGVEDLLISHWPEETS